MTFFYNLFVHLYPFFIRIAAIGNPKAYLWIKGRKNQFERLKIAVGENDKPIIWFHCASLGEFEQGRPVLERMKAVYPKYRILLTFFSPSGYEVRKNYPGADMVFYLPMDSKRNARKFLEITSPKLAVFVKYETWYNFLFSLKQQHIPALLISAVVYPHQFTFSLWSSFMQKTLALFDHIFTQSDDGLELLAENHIKTSFSLGGDTRYDRVNTLSALPFENRDIETFTNKKQVVVAGSTWPEDEKMLAGLLREKNDLKFIIAPHETSQKNIDSLFMLFPEALLLSQINKISNPENYKVLIIDSIGLLSKLYRYATIAYVGGGFNRAGIHNILEAAAYGKVVLFGPQYSRSNEAKEMIQLSLAYSFNNKEDLLAISKTLLNDPSLLQEKNEGARQFVLDRTGATEKILLYVEKKQLL
jgi:3-deoxy-D-manno-octulosonic-acid transferase